MKRRPSKYVNNISSTKGNAVWAAAKPAMPKRASTPANKALAMLKGMRLVKASNQPLAPISTINAALAINAPTAWPMVKPPAKPALANTAAPGVLQATITGLRIINDGMAVVRPIPMLMAQTQEASISCVAPNACAA